MLSLSHDVLALIASHFYRFVEVVSWLGTTKELRESKLRKAYIDLRKAYIDLMRTFGEEELRLKLYSRRVPDMLHVVRHTENIENMDTSQEHRQATTLAEKLAKCICFTRDLGRLRGVELCLCEDAYSMRTLVEALSTHDGWLWSHVRFIDLSPCPPIADVLQQMCAVIASGALNKLEHLSLDAGWWNDNEDAPIGDDGTVVLSKAIGSGFLGSLQSLSLVSNEIGDRGLKAFATASAWLPRLCELDLNDNDVGDVGDGGVVALADAIQNGSLGALKKLNLSQNRIADSHVAMHKLFLAIAKLKHLQFITLTHNNIGEKGARAISNAISRCSSVDLAVELDGNDIDDEGVMLLQRTIDDGNLAINIDIVTEFIRSHESR